MKRVNASRAYGVKSGMSRQYGIQPTLVPHAAPTRSRTRPRVGLQISSFVRVFMRFGDRGDEKLAPN